MADKLTAAGLKLESITSHGHDVKNVVVGEVLSVEELTGFKKPIRHCMVEVGEAEPRQIVCGASNFVAGDRVPVVLPGGVLPGGFEVGARKTYGRLSEGMICSERELGLGDDHNGIMVLPADTPIGADVVELLGLRDDVIELEITPDIGYALSIRGVAREAATAFGVAFRDPRRRRAAGRHRARLPGLDRRPDRVRQVRAARGARLRPLGAQPAVDAHQADQGGHAPGLPGRRRRQLRDAGARPAAAHLRQGQAERRDRRTTGARGRDAGDARPRRA
ncbi:hypothetical protein GCM10020219_004040 [Nonomuraea dietziae]